MSIPFISPFWDKFELLGIQGGQKRLLPKIFLPRIPPIIRNFRTTDRKKIHRILFKSLGIMGYYSKLVD